MSMDANEFKKVLMDLNDEYGPVERFAAAALTGLLASVKAPDPSDTEARIEFNTWLVYEAFLIGEMMLDESCDSPHFEDRSDRPKFPGAK